MKIGFIGLGIMGSRMANNLVKEEYNLTVWNRTKQKAKDIFEGKVNIANSPKEVVEHSEVIFTMLESPKVVTEVAEMENGLFSTLGHGKLWVDCSTVKPSFLEEISKLAISKGFDFLEAPVAGTKGPAESGELVFLIGGDKNHLQKIQPLLDTMSKKTIYVGEVGKAASMKLAINQMLALTYVSFCESLSLAINSGVPKELALNTLLNVPVTPPYLSAIRNRFEEGSDEINFPLKLILKDLKLMEDTAYENASEVRLVHAAKSYFTQATKNGFSENDFTKVFELFKL